MERFFVVVVLSFLVVGCSQDAHDVRADVRGVYQSARAIEGALGVGVTYADFGTLVREMSKELVLAGDRAKYASATPDPQVTKILDKYTELLLMYKDSSKVWQLQIQEKKYDDELPSIAAKYGVSSAIREWKERSYGITLNEKRVDYDQIRQTIWAKASKLQEEQAADVYGRFIPPTVQQRK